MCGEQQVYGQLRSRRRVLDDVARPGHGETLLHERDQDVVDALSRQTRLARDLCRRERIAPYEREVSLGLVAGETEASKLSYQLPVLDHVAIIPPLPTGGGVTFDLDVAAGRGVFRAH